MPFFVLLLQHHNFTVMFIKRFDKNSKKTGKSYFTCQLCESYRIDNRVHFCNVLNMWMLVDIRKEDFKSISSEDKVPVLMFLDIPYFLHAP